MSQDGMMRAMNAGMASTPLMPSSTPPQQAMRGYDLGPAADALGPAPVKGIAFDRLRCGKRYWAVMLHEAPTHEGRQQWQPTERGLAAQAWWR